ncbi:MAG: hypothetical protein ACI4VG_03520 [Lachnospiraceae bacterium]
MSEELVRKDYFEQVVNRIMDENKRLHKRVEELEDEIKKQTEISLTLERLAINLDHILNQLEAQSQRLKKLEEVPLETNKKVRDALINTIIGGVIGAFVAKLLTML